MEAIFCVFIITHFIRSFAIAIAVITREETVRSSPEEFLSLPEDKQEINVIKNAIAQKIAYANQTHEYIRKRGNRLIIAQHEFKYGLLFLLFIFIFHIAVIGMINGNKETSESMELIQFESKMTSETLSKQSDQIHEIKELTQELSDLKNGLITEIQRFEKDKKSNFDTTKVKKRK